MNKIKMILPELREFIQTLREKSKEDKVKNLEHLENYIVIHPECFERIMLTGKLQQIVDECGIESYSGPVRRVIEHYRKLACICDDDDLYQAVVECIFKDENVSSMTDAKFTLRRLGSKKSTFFIRDKSQFEETMNQKVFADAMRRYENSQTLETDAPVFFGGLGVKSMHPDFISTDRQVIVEFDGEYFHLDPKEAEFRKVYYDHIGKTCCIIWESEYNDFIADPPQTIEELIERYPCTWRNTRADENYILHHEYDVLLDKLEVKIAEEKETSTSV